MLCIEISLGAEHLKIQIGAINKRIAFFVLWLVWLFFRHISWISTLTVQEMWRDWVPICENTVFCQFSKSVKALHSRVYLGSHRKCCYCVNHPHTRFFYPSAEHRQVGEFFVVFLYPVWLQFGLGMRHFHISKSPFDVQEISDVSLWFWVCFHFGFPSNPYGRILFFLEWNWILVLSLRYTTPEVLHFS